MFEIQVNDTVRTNIGGYKFLSNLYHTIREQDKSQVKIDFSKCGRFDANLSSVLGALFDTLTDEGYEIWLSNFKSGVRRTLARNHFFKALEIKHNGSTEKENFISYRRFKTHESAEFKEYIQTELINKQKFPQHTELAGENIKLNIGEIFANAATHGDCSYVYCCGEYYPSETTAKLDMTVVDCGNTIQHKVNSFLLSQRKIDKNISATEAIKWAIQDGNTTKNVTGGLGLTMLIEFIKLNKGCLHIVSADGVLTYEEEKITSYSLGKPFPGTIVNMEFNFDDNKIYHMSNETIDLNNLL